MIGCFWYEEEASETPPSMRCRNEGVNPVFVLFNNFVKVPLQWNTSASLTCVSHMGWAPDKKEGKNNVPCRVCLILCVCVCVCACVCVCVCVQYEDLGGTGMMSWGTRWSAADAHPVAFGGGHRKMSLYAWILTYTLLSVTASLKCSSS